MLWRRALGFLTYEPSAGLATADTIFDLASLTKVIATTSLAMRASTMGGCGWRIRSRAGSLNGQGTIAGTLRSRTCWRTASGLTAYLPFYQATTRAASTSSRRSAELPLEYAPRTQSIYSDLGFMLLGFILEDAQRRSASFSGAPGASRSRDAGSTRNSDGSRRSVTAEPLAFNPPRSWRDRTAPTEVDPWRGRLLVGEVHDENAWALGGAAGHAGLFGTVARRGRVRARGARHARRRNQSWPGPRPCGGSSSRQDVPGSSRALGWDTMLPTSSCGTRAVADARSATPDSPARRSGSTGSATSTSCC